MTRTVLPVPQKKGQPGSSKPVAGPTPITTEHDIYSFDPVSTPKGWHGIQFALQTWWYRRLGTRSGHVNGLWAELRIIDEAGETLEWDTVKLTSFRCRSRFIVLAGNSHLSAICRFGLDAFQCAAEQALLAIAVELDRRQPSPSCRDYGRRASGDSRSKV